MKENDPPLISVIVAVFNGSKTLQQCIDSIVGQTYPKKELIIIDGGSEDGTTALLEANKRNISYWVSEPDNGIYNAWNKGLRKAKGEWICFLGADDYFWEQGALEHMVEQLVMVSADIRVAYGKIMLLNKEGEIVYPVGEPWSRMKARFKQVMSIPHPGLMHRRSLFDHHGEFDESFRISGDYELLLRELKTSDAVFIPDVIIAGMRQGGISSSALNSLRSLREARRAQRLHGLTFPGPIWIVAMARIYTRLLLWNTLGERRARSLLDLARKLKGTPPYWTKT